LAEEVSESKPVDGKLLQIFRIQKMKNLLEVTQTTGFLNRAKRKHGSYPQLNNLSNYILLIVNFASFVNK
jgi:hypothetical protein